MVNNQKSNLELLIDTAIKPLKDLSPPCHSINKEVSDLVRNWATIPHLFPGNKGSKLWILLHRHKLSLQKLGMAVATALYNDNKAFIVVDCSLPENDRDGLFGTPPGYQSCLDGGLISNQLKIRPESVVLLANFEFADKTL